MNNDKHSGGIHPYRASRKEQFVLITENGKERTSNVTDERIFQAVYEVDSHSLVGLEKCVPVAIGPSTYVFAMSYNDDSLFAVHIDIKGSILRVLHRNGGRPAVRLLPFIPSARHTELGMRRTDNCSEKARNPSDR